MSLDGDSYAQELRRSLRLVERRDPSAPTHQAQKAPSLRVEAQA